MGPLQRREAAQPRERTPGSKNLTALRRTHAHLLGEVELEIFRQREESALGRFKEARRIELRPASVLRLRQLRYGGCR